MAPLANRSLKRTKDEDEGPEPSSKRPKKAEDLTDTDMKALYARNQLNKLTVMELKDWGKMKKLRIDNKKKAELISLVEEYFEKT